MDDTPQNPNNQENPAEQNTGNYQQYLNTDTESKSKKRRKLIIITASAILALLVMSVGLIVAFSGDDSQQTTESQSTQVPSEVCNDEDCFNRTFAECSPATYAYTESEEESSNSIKYTITGDKRDGCIINLEYLGGNFIADGAGKAMTCDFDNTVDYGTATRNVFTFPEDYDCEGSLVPLLQELNDAAGES